MLRRRVMERGLQVHLEQGKHLRIAVLFHHVNPVVLLHKIVHFAGKRISAQTQIVGLDVVFLAQLVAGFDQPPVRSAVSDDPDL